MNVEFHFDFGSPNAYLSHRAIPSIEKRTGVKFTYVPVLIGGVFKATGNASPAVTLQGIKNKTEYQNIEMERFLNKHNITDYSPNPFFPVNTLQVMRGAIFAQTQDYYERYIHEVYQHMWCEPKKMDEPEVIRTVFEDSGLPAAAIIEAMQDPTVKQTLIDNTNRSVEMGAFGSPTFFVENEIFFGKDKLIDVEDEIIKNN
ncbi:MAG: 2-hydroxychromene-2-carboxylate isomerase [Gammaproteobacteria bacterium]|mgnify:FL=1|nr:2-hydroxychromene-2-carboxylate isomerase [Gammaproteobacteria bacterium]MBT6584732.1 2-hydroxychromene-2-carboxylate isomerase [Gammaproteobacteria bacterium]MBT7879908.1 2-hydroxychromene-2-carboxylate isomerase [Gammaproteobacteria bacterium]